MSRALVLLSVLVLAAGCGGDGDAPASLDGTAWFLTSGVDVAQDTEVTTPTASFSGGSIAGSGGCNRYSGTYSVEGESITISPLAMTEMACGPSASAVETAFLAALSGVRGWSIDGDELVLDDAAGAESLRFRPAPTS